VTHFNQCLPDDFHGSHDTSSAEVLRVLSDDVGTLLWQLHQLWCHERQETITKCAHDAICQSARVATLLYGKCDRGDTTRLVAGNQGFEYFVDGDRLIKRASTCDRELES
jgi:hypothetical protein